MNLVITLLIIFIFYFNSVFYGLKAYDELVLFKESYLPVCHSFSEMLELISLLGLNHCNSSSNTLYSSIVSLRCNPLGNFLQLFIQVLFQKNPVYYHLYSLFLHLVNSAFVFLILKKFSNSKSLFIPILTLTWALHPVNVESVLLLSNANILLSYTFAFIAMYFCTVNTTPIKSIFLFFIFSLALFTAEFHFMLPFILFSYLIAFNQGQNFKLVFKAIFPLILAAFIFILYFLFSNTRINIGLVPSFELTLQRIFWFSPQILFHLVILLLLPLKLSIDQTFLIKTGESLLNPYAMFCMIFFLMLLIISVISLIKAKSRYPYFFIIVFPLLLSLVPFSQILAPTYNLASERYLYFPSFILIFGISRVLFSCRGVACNAPTIGILLIFLFAFGARAYIRTLDWKNNFTLYQSAIKATKNPLYKAFRYKGLLSFESLIYNKPTDVKDEIGLGYLELAIKNLKLAISSLKEKRIKYQSQLPAVIKSYGLDPDTLLVKAGYLLAQTDFSINKDPKKALLIMEENVHDFSLLDSAGITFYASLLYHNNLLDKAESVLTSAYKKEPYSLKVIYLLSDLIQIKYQDIDRIEDLAKKAFKLYPYDTSTLFLLSKIYETKKDMDKYAHFSYIYNLRSHHSTEVKKRK